MGLTVSRQTGKNFTVNHQTEREFSTVSPRQKKQLLQAIKRFQRISNLTISATHLGLLALNHFNWYN